MNEPAARPWRRRLGRAVDIGLWILVVGLLLWRFGPQVGAAIGIGGGDRPLAPDFVVTTLDGEDIRLHDLRGQVVLLNFWATWCPPCRLEMPGFQRVWDDYRDQGLVIIGLSTDRDATDQVQTWLRDREISYPVALATGPVLAAYDAGRVLPTSFLVSRDGRIAHRVEGFYAEPTLRAAVRRLLREQP